MFQTQLRSSKMIFQGRSFNRPSLVKRCEIRRGLNWQNFDKNFSNVDDVIPRIKDETFLLETERKEWEM